LSSQQVLKVTLLDKNEPESELSELSEVATSTPEEGINSEKTDVQKNTTEKFDVGTTINLDVKKEDDGQMGLF
ncbi:MAG TPA: hypothetical protein DCR46_05930, partial [Cytophagales bacterium]|nr:hypothetical protein [Cytophagales bacterium]